MLLRRFTDIYPKELARDRREFCNSLLSGLQLPLYAKDDKKVESSGATVHSFGTNNATIDLTDTGNDAFWLGSKACVSTLSTDFPLP